MSANTFDVDEILRRAQSREKRALVNLRKSASSLQDAELCLRSLAVNVCTQCMFNCILRLGKTLLRSYDSTVEDAQRPFPKEEKVSPRGKVAFQKGRAGKKHIATDSSATLVEDSPTPKASKAKPGASTPEGMPTGVRRALRRPQTVDMLNTSERMTEAKALQRNLSREFAAVKEKQAAEATADDEGSSKKEAKAKQISPEKTPATSAEPRAKANPKPKANSKMKPETSNEPPPTRGSKKPKPLPTEAEEDAYAIKDHDTAASTSEAPTPPAEKKQKTTKTDQDSSPDKKKRASKQVADEKAKKDACEQDASKKAEKDAGKQDADKKAKKDAGKQDADKKAKKDAGKQDADKKAKKDAGEQDANKKAKKDAGEQDADKKAKDAGDQEADKKAKDAGCEIQEESEDKSPSTAKKQAHKLHMRFYRNVHRQKLRLKTS